MKNSSVFTRRFAKPLCLFVASMACAQILSAQDRDKYDEIAARYKNEHAVYTNYAGRLVITIEEGNLVANNYMTQEKLYINDLSLNSNNKDYFEYGDFNQLTGYSGVAYLPARGKTYKRVECNAFGSGRPRDYVFYDDTRVAAAYYSGLRKNAITETKYSTENTDIHMLSGFIFQDIYTSLPVDEASYEVVVPKNVTMGFALEGGNTSMIKQTKEEKNGKIYYRFTATGVPAPKDLDNVPSWRYYVPHVIPYIVSFRLDGAKKDSIVSKTPADLYKYLYSHVRGINMKTDTFLTKKATELTKNDATQAEKAAHIFKWVQDNIHYVAIENGLEGFVPRPADTVMKRKYGDCKDMASIISAMCRTVGVKAYLTWIGTNHVPYNIEGLPLNINFNHMICAALINDEWVFLDGTHALQPYGCNREDIQGKEAMIAIDANNYKIVTIPVEPAGKNIVSDSTYVKIDGRRIAGSLTQSYKGFDAWDVGYGVMYNKKDDDREKYVRSLTARGTNKYAQKKYALNAAGSGNKDVTINADFVVDDYVQNAGKEYFVNMNLLRHFHDKRIDIKDRTAPNYLDHKTKRREVVVLEIPKGYKVAYLPAAAKGSLDNVWSYSITYKADKKKITLIKEYEITGLSIGPDKFTDNNKLVDDLNRSYKESVVLTTN